MSFKILGVEPTYNYVADTYRWSFFNKIDVQQYQMCSGEVRYVCLTNVWDSEMLFTTNCKDISEREFLELEKLLIKKLWMYFHSESCRVGEIFDIINQLALDKESKEEA